MAEIDTGGSVTSFFDFWSGSGSGIITFLLALAILLCGLRLVKMQIEKKGIGKYTFQMFGLAIFLPALLILGANDLIDKTVLATLLGALAGYIFGATNKSDDNPKP